MENSCCINEKDDILPNGVSDNELGNSSCTPSNKKDDILLMGISVLYLKDVLLQEVDNHKDLDLNEAKVYDLEPDLKSTTFGLIREKGANVTCPRDYKLGAAYVDSIKQCDDYVGRATVMLSYSWGYGIKSIVDTLVAKCEADDRQLNRTYVWICCLCNNQHRISNSQVPFDQFRDTFYGTVTGVGRLWSMMSPWDDPLYLKRVWCVFEIYVANTEPGVEAEIIMPRHDEKALVESLDDFEKLLAVLSKTKIENAEATVEDDKRNILALVEEKVGFNELNGKVNGLLKEWITAVLMNVVEQGKSKIDDLGHGRILCGIGMAFEQLGNYDKALEVLEESLGVNQRVLGKEEDADTAKVYNGIGQVKYMKKDYDSALEMYNQALAINLKVLGKEHADTATSYQGIGYAKHGKDDLVSSLEMHQQALAIRLKVLGTEHEHTGYSYNDIGDVKKAKGDLDGALEMYQQALEIYMKVYDSEHVNIAVAYNNIGLVKNDKDDLDGALEMFQQALEIYMKVYDSEHANTATAYSNIGLVKHQKDDLEGALEMFQQALEIKMKVYGEDHPETIQTLKNIAYVKDRMSHQQD